MLSRAAVRRLYFVRFTRGHHKFSPTKPRTSFPFVPFAVRLTFFQGRSTVAWSVVLMVAIRWLLGLTSWYSGGSGYHRGGKAGEGAGEGGGGV